MDGYPSGDLLWFTYPVDFLSNGGKSYPMDLLKKLTVLSLEQATVLPYLTYRLAHDGVQVIRLEHPVYGDPNRMIGENILNEERMNSYFPVYQRREKSAYAEPGRTRRAGDFPSAHSGTENRCFCHQPASQKLQETGHRLRNPLRPETGYHLAGCHRVRSRTAMKAPTTPSCRPEAG